MFKLKVYYMAQCVSPFRNKDGIFFPCGKCLYCQKNRAAGWSFRLLNHLKKNPLCSFVTLTYDSDHVPYTEKGRTTLNKDDVKKFLNRLKINQKRYLEKFEKKGYVHKYSFKDIKYYLAAEYGTKRSRPHYHLIIFNAEPSCIIKSWMVDGKPIGSIYFGTVTPASIGYTLKYISKPSKVPQYKGDDRLPEFQLQSKGLGLSYLTDSMVRWHLSDLFGRYYGNIPNSDIKVGLPRYYKEKIYTSAERYLIGESIQSKYLESVVWGSDFDPVNQLFRNDYNEYERRMRDKYVNDKLKNENSWNIYDRF